MKNEFNVLDEFNKKIAKVFLFCPRTQELKEYKEEVVGSLMDKYNDLTAQGYNKEVAFDKCVESIEQFYDKNIVKQLEEIKGIKKKEKLSKESLKLVGWGVLTYIFLTLVVFFSVAISPVGWALASITFGISIGLAILGGITLGIVKAKTHSAYSINRITIWLIGMSLVTLLYLILSLALYYSGKFVYTVGTETASVWALTWLTFIFGLVVVDGADLIYRMKSKKRIYSAFDAFIMTIFVTLSVYLSTSMICDIVLSNSIWNDSWIIFMIGILFYVLLMFIRQVFKLIKAKEQVK